MLEAAATLSMLMKNFDFEFAIPPEEVGMKTGATIHTMNGLMMRARKVSDGAPVPSSENWWEMQHLKRGLSANGRPFASEDDVVRQVNGLKKSSNDGKSGCPVHGS